jgi:hypothetical protein
MTGPFPANRREPRGPDLPIVRAIGHVISTICHFLTPNDTVLSFGKQLHHAVMYRLPSLLSLLRARLQRKCISISFPVP